MVFVRYVTGYSMAPALRPGRLVFARRRMPMAPLRVGDIVVIRHGGLEKIKRISELAVDKLYVEGDNKLYSTDSRHFGWIDRNSIIGKVIWPRV